MKDLEVQHVAVDVDQHKFGECSRSQLKRQLMKELEDILTAFSTSKVVPLGQVF